MLLRRYSIEDIKWPETSPKCLILEVYLFKCHLWPLLGRFSGQKKSIDLPPACQLPEVPAGLPQGPVQVPGLLQGQGPPGRGGGHGRLLPPQLPAIPLDLPQGGVLEDHF